MQGSNTDGHKVGQGPLQANHMTDSQRTSDKTGGVERTQTGVDLYVMEG